MECPFIAFIIALIALALKRKYLTHTKPKQDFWHKPLW